MEFKLVLIKNEMEKIKLRTQWTVEFQRQSDFAQSVRHNLTQH